MKGTLWYIAKILFIDLTKKNFFLYFFCSTYPFLLVIVSVGSPPQEFVALLDTSSDYTWIPDKDCGVQPDDCDSYCTGEYCGIICEDRCCQGSSSACQYKQKFNGAQSSTYWSSYGNFKQQTTLGLVQGGFGYDKFAVGKGKQIAFALDDYRFGMANSLGPKFSRMALDGVLGLGRSEYNRK